jgi:hypothetical protein
MKQGVLKEEQEDQEVNAADRGNWKLPPADQKERRLFHRPPHMISSSVELISIVRRCKTNQWRKSLTEEIIVGPTQTTMNNLMTQTYHLYEKITPDRAFQLELTLHGQALNHEAQGGQDTDR